MKLKVELKLVNYLLSQQSTEKGFTLIELLVVIIIIGILAAIALPSFLNQSSKARQTEAKTYLGTLNLAQQAYYTEKQTFAAGLDRLNAGVNPTTENYNYVTFRDGQSAINTASPISSSALKSYAGAVSPVTLAGSDGLAIPSAICEALQPVALGGTQTPTVLLTFNLPFPTNAAPQCNGSNLTTGFIAVN